MDGRIVNCCSGRANWLTFADVIVISDPDDPNFDLEKYLTKVSEDSP